MWNLLLQSKLNQKRNRSIDFDQIWRLLPAKFPKTLTEHIWKTSPWNSHNYILLLPQRQISFWGTLASQKIGNKDLLWRLPKLIHIQEYTYNCYKSKKYNISLILFPSEGRCTIHTGIILLNNMSNWSSTMQIQEVQNTSGKTIFFFSNLCRIETQSLGTPFRFKWKHSVFGTGFSSSYDKRFKL